MSKTQRVLLLAGLAAVCAGILFTLSPIPQDPAYHDFADRRAFLGVPNFGDVVGNLAFALVGAWGLAVTRRRRRELTTPGELPLWVLFFTGAFLVAFGSGYYHLTPDNPSLVWDRLPMTIAFMSLFSIVTMERVDARLGTALFPILLAAGIGSVWYWIRTENLGRGDLRPYAFIQFFPLVSILLMLALFPQRHPGARYLMLTLVWYGLAKLLEHFDDEVFSLTARTISGHSLKHLAAAVSVGCVAKYLDARRATNTAG